MTSHPSWVCGLKQKSQENVNKSIESHPSWVCGLKLKVSVNLWVNAKSHPSWVCGLKQPKLNKGVKAAHVTPFVGVWIETAIRCCNLVIISVTPFVGVWIET